VQLTSVVTVPPSTTFLNGEHVYLPQIRKLPEATRFKNKQDVELNNLVDLEQSTRFENGEHVRLHSLTKLPDNFAFQNGKGVVLLRAIGKNLRYQGRLFLHERLYGTFPILVHLTKEPTRFEIRKAVLFTGGSMERRLRFYVAIKDGTIVGHDTRRKALRAFFHRVDESARFKDYLPAPSQLDIIVAQSNGICADWMDSIQSFCRRLQGHVRGVFTFRRHLPSQ
ncbi:MAG: hypothetical protein AAGF28_12575, partial [Pseudomonadota bacterium]